MAKPIAVGVNESAASQAALLWAAHRAAQNKLSLVILHVVDDRWVAESYPYGGIMRDMGEELLRNAEDRAREAEPSLDVSVEFLEGSIGAALGKYSGRVSMLVIGSGGGSRLGGPVTDRALQVAAVAKCPVAVIGKEEAEGGQGVVVGVDGSEESVQAVAFAAAEADREGQELTVLYAFSGPNRWVKTGLPSTSLAAMIVEEENIVLAETVAGLRDEFPDLTVHKALETEKEPVTALIDAAANARLLVVGSRGRGSFRRLLLGSTAHGVLTQLPCPTIITRVDRVKRKKSSTERATT